jgi:hypothetical protein
MPGMGGGFRQARVDKRPNRALEVIPDAAMPRRGEQKTGR